MLSRHWNNTHQMEISYRMHVVPIPIIWHNQSPPLHACSPYKELKIRTTDVKKKKDTNHRLTEWPIWPEKQIVIETQGTHVHHAQS